MVNASDAEESGSTTNDDAALMESMGFASFATRSSKKRRVDDGNPARSHEFSEKPGEAERARNDSAAQPINSPGETTSFDHAQSAPIASSRDAALPLLSSFKAAAQSSHETAAAAAAAAHASQRAPASLSSSSQRLFEAPLDALAPNELQALRFGVRNAEGDQVYFLPSFLEDPWRDLER